MQIMIKNIFLQQTLNIQRTYVIFIVIYHFYLKEAKLKNARSLLVTYITKKTCCAHNGFKTSIKSQINTKKVPRAIQFNQKAWLKPYIDMNTKLRTGAKNDFKKDLFKLINNAVFGEKNNRKCQKAQRY